MAGIQTPRLLLRPARPSDVVDLHGVLSDRRAMRYWSSLPHATIAQTRAWLSVAGTTYCAFRPLILGKD